MVFLRVVLSVASLGWSRGASLIPRRMRAVVPDGRPMDGRGARAGGGRRGRGERGGRAAIGDGLGMALVRGRRSGTG